MPGHHARKPGHERPDRSRSPGTRALQRARRTGERPFALEVHDRVGEDLARARSWQEFVETLNADGLHLEIRHRGMLITDGRRYAPASRVSRLAGRILPGVSCGAGRAELALWPATLWCLKRCT